MILHPLPVFDNTSCL